MADNGDRFLEVMSGYLVALPHDLKVLLQAASEENLERPARELATGTILYILAPNDAVPADHPHLAFVDDAILLRLALDAVAKSGGEGAADFQSRFPEYYDGLREELDVLREYLGAECYDWLGRKLQTVHKGVYKGKNVAKYLDDAEANEFLYEESLVFATEYLIDEEAVSRMKRAEPIRQHLHRRMAEDAKRIT